VTGFPLADDLEYFGNPGCWAPSLSFEANSMVSQDEIESCIRTLYLSYWLGNAASPNVIPDGVTQNLLARDGDAHNLAALDAKVLTNLNEMVQRARQRLLEYQYYVGKADDYQLLQPIFTRNRPPEASPNIVILGEGAAERQSNALPSQLWEALMSGAIGVHFFHWNDRNMLTTNYFFRERGFGIVSETRLPKEPVYSNFVSLFRRVEDVKIDDLLGGSVSPHPAILCFWSRQSDMGWPRANQENAMVWGALKRLGIIDDEQFARGAYTNSSAVLLSRAYQLSPSVLETVTNQLIPAGIHLHANADLPGQFNANHQPNPNWPELMRRITPAGQSKDTICSEQTRVSYPFVGQLHSEAGYGTGFLVRPGVVLTAAHVIFDETTQDFAKDVWWIFRRSEADKSGTIKVKAKAMYVLDGYAKQRRLERQMGLPLGTSTEASRQSDVAVLYFDEPIVPYVSFDHSADVPNPSELLTNVAVKILIGYPMIGPTAGRIQAMPAPLGSFTHDSGQLYSTKQFPSYPGNSGGPLCVRYQNEDGEMRYFPAAVYLGMVGGRSVVRAIDADVMALINRAAEDSWATSGSSFSCSENESDTVRLDSLHVNLKPAKTVTSLAASLKTLHVFPHMLHQSSAMDLLHHDIDHSLIAMSLDHESMETAADLPACRSETRHKDYFSASRSRLREKKADF